jgi:hypothetical protein
MIEHRLGMRESIERRVCIYRPKQRAIFGHCENISSSGMWVRSFRTDLAVNAKVQLVTVWREGKIFRIHRVHAVVARVGRKGIGLMFAEQDIKAVYHLLARLRGHGGHDKNCRARDRRSEAVDIVPEEHAT